MRNSRLVLPVLAEVLSRGATSAVTLDWLDRRIRILTPFCAFHPAGIGSSL
jgi:hypothetical protein